jgi:hypothetical protein
MRLESAQSLKLELLQQVVEPLTAGVGRARTAGARAFAVRLKLPGMAPDPSLFGVGARSVDGVPEVQRSLALGVAPHGTSYRLAIRLQRPALRHSQIVEHLTRKARGEVDVRLIGRIDKRPKARRVTTRSPSPATAAGMTPWYQRNTRPLLIGASIGHVDITAGTIGAFVRRGREVSILSNNHVLANEDEGRVGDWILQRARLDGGRRAERVARLSHWVRLKPRGANLVDAALAALEKGASYDANLLRGIVGGKDRKLRGLGPEFVDEGSTVYKVGRTTGARRGRVTAFGLDNVVVSYDLGNVRFDDQIEIEGSGELSFSDGGDSGSLIVNSRMEAIALLFAGSETGGRNGAGLTYANPIRRALTDLGAELLP